MGMQTILHFCVASQVWHFLSLEFMPLKRFVSHEYAFLPGTIEEIMASVFIASVRLYRRMNVLIFPGHITLDSKKDGNKSKLETPKRKQCSM